MNKDWKAFYLQHTQTSPPGNVDLETIARFYEDRKDQKENRCFHSLPEEIQQIWAYYCFLADVCPDWATQQVASFNENYSTLDATELVLGIRGSLNENSFQLLNTAAKCQRFLAYGDLLKPFATPLTLDQTKITANGR
jgi:hypothetical protein